MLSDQHKTSPNRPAPRGKPIVFHVRHKVPGKGRLVRLSPRIPSRATVERLEPRMMLSADPIQFGAVYAEQDLGSDLSPDTIEIQFGGGADGTELTRVDIDGDQFMPGLSLADMLFDTQTVGLGVDVAHEGLVASQTGQFTTEVFVEDGSSLLTLRFQDFRAGDRLTLSLDVDEVQGFDPAETDQRVINEDLDPIASGAEFQGSQLTVYFSAPHFEDATGTAEFRNRYDDRLTATSLDLPLDDENGNRDRTAGAVGETVQTPRPVSISGRVFDDRNADAQQAATDPGISGVELSLFVEDDGQFIFTGHTAVTDAAGDYTFSTDLGLMPGTYEVREAQPDG